MRTICKKTLIAVGILVAGIFLGTGLLFLSFVLPEEPMQKHLQESVPALTAYVGSSEIMVGYQASYDGIFTDSLMLQNAVYDEGHSVFEKAMGIYRNGFEDGVWLPREALVEYLSGETSVEYSYARYWHGYLVVLKPLLLLFNWGEIQFLNQIVQTLLLIAVTIGLVKRGKEGYAVAYGIAFLFLVPVIMPVTLSLSVCLYLYLILNLLQLCLHEKLVIRGWYLYFFLLAGMATSYMDFLTFPIVTLGLPMAFYFLLSERKTVKESLVSVAKYSVSWGVGYIGMWASKWILGSMILGQNVLKDASDTLSQRTDSISYDSRILSFLSVLWDNLKMYKALPYILLVVVLIVITVFMAVKYPSKSKITVKLKACIPYVLIALMPFAWYFVALNHSGEHYMFTFRALIVTAFAGCCMMHEFFEYPGKRKKDNGKLHE